MEPKMTASQQTLEQQARDVSALVRVVGTLLSKKHPDVIGAALADLTAIWIAGHACPGNQQETDRMRDELLTAHIEAIETLIPANAREEPR
jgi:fructose-1,6-bisphosphatase